MKQPYNIELLTLLHPQASHQFIQLQVHLVQMHRAGKTPTLFLAHSGYRDPAKQNVLYDSGRGVTKVKAFESAHQYGLAVDFVPWVRSVDGKYNWSWAEEHDYPFLKIAARGYGLSVPLAWDKVHVEHPLWKRIKAQWAPAPKAAEPPTA